MARVSWPWRVEETRSGDDPEEVFITRVVHGVNLGGGTEVAIVTTGSYTDEQEAFHALLIASLPDLVLAALQAAGTFDGLATTLAKDERASELVATLRKQHDGIMAILKRLGYEAATTPAG